MPGFFSCAPYLIFRAFCWIRQRCLRETRKWCPEQGYSQHERFPMIDSITEVDLLKGELHATKVFSLEKDLWLADHKPYQVPETSTWSRQLWSLNLLWRQHACYILTCRCVQYVKPSFWISWNALLISDASRRFSAGGYPSSAGEIVCEVSLSSSEISPTGRIIDRTFLNYKAQVVLGRETGIPL